MTDIAEPRATKFSLKMYVKLDFLRNIFNPCITELQ